MPIKLDIYIFLYHRVDTFAGGLFGYCAMIYVACPHVRCQLSTRLVVLTVRHSGHSKTNSCNN